MRNRSFFYFTASNPSIDFGGMLGEEKSKIFELIPDKYTPQTILVSPNTPVEDLHKIIEEKSYQFPLILKPDIGERGWMVKKINQKDQLKEYLDKIQVPFLIQEYIDLPLEAGMFYYRYPNQSSGKVSSVVIKEMLTVEGDGKSNIRQLMALKPRAKLQIATIAQDMGEDFLNQVPEDGKQLELVSIGNHCLGTKFLNGNSWIDHRLEEALDKLAKTIPGFYFGRFDLRCKNIEDLRKLKNFKIMELNGAGAEPGHIYEPGYTLFQAYRDIYHHLKVLSDISRINHKFGVPYWSFKRGMAKMKAIRAYNKNK